MRRTTTICDRCSTEIVEGAAVLTVEAGDLRDRLHQPVDLCRKCAGRLAEWLATGRETQQEPGNCHPSHQAESGRENANS
jgi:hypothetical protein